MTIIIRNNTVITTNTSYSEQVQIASGATLTIMPGVSINLNGNKMLIAGSLNLSGSATNFSNITNGTISTENTSGSIIAINAKFTGVTIDDFFSNGSIQATSSVFDSSFVKTLPSSAFTSVLFTNTTLDISGTKGGSFIHDTFLNSPMSIMAWWGGSQTSISDSNFIGTGNVITLDPFFSGNGFSHNISITNSYIAGVTGPAIDGKIFDADDDIRVSTDITPSSFTSSPYVNDVNGFRIGNTLVSLNQLGVIDSTAPIVSTFTPADNSISAPITSNISLRFNEVIQKGAGIIAIHSGSAAGTVVESFNATNSSRLTILGNTLTINPTNNLANNTHYFVTFASGTVKDLAGNNYIGTNVYDFTTVKNTITSTTGNDKLVGTIGDDILNGGAGADKMTGGVGNDTYYVDNIGDLVTETSALLTEIDTVYSAVTYTLGANVENLVLIGAAAINATGNALNNTLTGNAAANILSGLAGNDSLNGGLGADKLIGGKGQDNLTGGAGRDTFTFAAGDDGITAATLDKILDYAKGAVGKGDLIDYSVNLTKGGNANIATATQASINQSTGIATFASGSGTTLADALNDITARLTAATNTAGEFACFKINNTGNYYLFVSDGTAGAGVNDDLIQLVGVTSISAIDLTGGNLTIIS
jgi:Ca2+-binding RTX toxin-like protein